MEYSPEWIEQITQQVIRILLENRKSCPSATLPRALIAGKTEKAGETLCRYFSLETSEDYQRTGDVSPYAFILITSLSNAQLCDIALGRDSTPNTCMVVSALLAGKPVFLLPDALSHRRFQKTANPRFYQLLEGYVQRLETFGIRLLPLNEVENALLGSSVPVSSADIQSCPSQNDELFPGKLIDAQAAQALAKVGKKYIRLARGVVITPLARDILRSAGTEILTEKGETPC